MLSISKYITKRFACFGIILFFALQVKGDNLLISILGEKTINSFSVKITRGAYSIKNNSSIYNLVFGIDSIEKARIDTNGNLGIGTTSPVATLHVSGSSGATATFQGSTQSTMNLKVGSFDNYLVGTEFSLTFASPKEKGVRTHVAAHSNQIAILRS